MFALKKVVLSASLALCLSTVATAQPLQTELQKESYAVGASVGNYLSAQIDRQTKLGADIDMKLVITGFEDALQNKTQLKADDLIKVLNARAEKLNDLEEAAKAKIAKANAEKSKAYLAENAKKKGVHVTKSGLQYEVVKEGKGDKARIEDVVTVNYVGKFIDGKVFESTYEKKEPGRFVMMSVIDGLSEGIAMMTPGSRYIFTIPANLAWGADGAGNGQIPPESAVIFDLELVKVDKISAHSNFSNANLQGMVKPH